VPLPLSDVAAGAAPEPDPDAVPVLVSRDYSRLRMLARLWRHPDDPVGRVLAGKLDRCRVVPPDAVPPAVAVPGARVVFAAEGAAPESRLLVMPEDDAQDGSTLAVSTPVGAALLGAAAGQPVEAVGRDGRRILLHLLAVDHQHGLRPAGPTPPERRAPHGAARYRTAAPGASPRAGTLSNYGGRS
jgi:regulator of nucleoside diphosphate kinase